ncbi:MAG: DUF4118 domain-containing protein [Bryobacterales bacterium]|nr:DUF4118 domain-containing protein [Bryobacterales bacterium]
MGAAGRFSQGVAFGLAALAAGAGLFTQVLPVNATTVGFLFLIVVLAVATARGLAAAAVVSVAATLSLNFYFLPPVGRFTIADPENWVALFTFLLTALVVSHLSDRAQQEAAQARGSQRETEQLYALSRAILLTDASRPIGTQAAQSIAQVFGLPGAVVFDAASGELHRGGPVDLDAGGDTLMPVLLEVVRQGLRREAGASGAMVWPIALGGHPVGALAVRGMTASDGAVQSALNLVAIALERVRTGEAASRAEAARQSEEFKSTLLDAIAHEFKTPLTSIKAAATGLRMAADASLPADQRELTTIIVEETDRLSRLVSDAVQMAGIDAGKTAPQRSRAAAQLLFEQVRQSFNGRDEGRLRLAPEHEAEVWADRDLIVLALRQLADNALKYAGGAVTLSAHEEKDRVLLHVADLGPGVPERDRQRIFDKFYRRPPARQLPGTGLGLHIAREIARIHGGDLWVEAGEPQGAVFCLALPAEESARV